MADVIAKCSVCGHEVAVSEFVDRDLLKCGACGGQLVVPHGPTSATTREAPTVIRRREEMLRKAQEEKAQRQEKPQVKRAKRKARAKQKRQSTIVKLGGLKLNETALSWIMFIVLVIPLCYFSYFDVLEKNLLDQYRMWGMIIMFVFYAVVVVEAMKEDMFEGLLCLFVPGYGLYYLYVKSDSFYLRAIVAALGFAFCVEAYVVVGGWMYRTYVDLYEQIKAGA